MDEGLVSEYGGELLSGKDLSGACFDVPDNKAMQVEDLMEHA
jgi:hypothetical protein